MEYFAKIEGGWNYGYFITLHTNCVPYWVEFDGDEPMRLEDCPDCFFDTLILNIKMGNYTMPSK